MPIPDPITIDPTRPQEFAEAVDYFRRQAPWISGSSWATMARLSAQKGDQISGATMLAMVDDIWKRMDKSLAEGTPFSEFVRDIGRDFKRDWVGIDSPRLNLIYHNNVGSALMAGRMAQITDPDVVADRPYFLFDAIEDFRTSDICQPIGGIIRPASDPFWGTHTPLLHHHCRSTIISLDEDDMRAEGGITHGNRIANLPAAEDGFGSMHSWEDWQPDGRDYAPALFAQYTAWRDGEPYAHERSEWLAALAKSWEKAGIPSIVEQSPDMGSQWDITKDDSLEGSSIRAALSLINEVHGDGGMSRYRAIVDDTETSAASGWHESPSPSLNKEGVVAIVSGAENKAEAVETALHEFGHSIDLDVLKKKPELREKLVEVLMSTPEVKALQHKRSQSISNIGKYRYETDYKALDYLLRDKEIIARAYAQYIAAKLNIPSILDLHDEEARGEMYPSQWHLENFARVIRTFDEVFKELGWLRLKEMKDEETPI